MRLMNIDEYAETYYTEQSRPSRRTIIRLINEGTLPGKKLGRNYYIDVDALEAMSGMSLVDGVLLDGG